MAANALLKKLVTIYRGEELRYPQLRTVTLAQWMLESGRATSSLAKLHYNFGGLKWRPEMKPYATRISYEANDGVDFYCKFATIENFVSGYWAFLNRAPYSGWEEHTETAEEFIGFIGPIYTPSKNYAQKVLALVPEAQGLLDSPDAAPAVVANTTTDLGTIVIDPGHGGTVKVGGSSPNNAISWSGVKEKKLTLDFCLILRDELQKQAAQNGEAINVVLTRTQDINVGIDERAGMAFTSRAKLFLCLHFNGDSNTSIRGCETYYRSQERNLNLQDDKAFAQSVQAALIAALKALDPGAKDRGIKPDTDSGPGGMGVLDDRRLGNDKVAKMCRSAYIELEFISNKTVDQLLISGAAAIPNRTKVMSALAKAIRAQMRSMP